MLLWGLLGEIVMNFYISLVSREAMLCLKESPLAVRNSINVAKKGILIKGCGLIIQLDRRWQGHRWWGGITFYHAERGPEESLVLSWPTAEGANVHAEAQRLTFIQRRESWEMREFKCTLMKKFMN